MAETSRQPLGRRLRRRLARVGLTLLGGALIGALAATRSPGVRRRDNTVEARADANPETAFEPADWPVGTVALVLLSILLVLVAAPLVLWWAYPNAASDVNRALTTPMPAPRLEVHPQADLARLRAAQARALDTYYWIDKQHGIVHIPITQAMQTLARQGIAGFPQAPR